ncbi:MAG: amidohydrolase family protein, partial [Casimicrobiaceae bacterium]
THAAMTLLRGHGDDRALQDWLQNYIWPAEAALVDPEFVRVGTLLAAAEMLAGGTTTCADMYFYPEAAGRAFVRMGMRAQLAMPVLDFPTRYASDADGYLRANLDARDALADEPLLSWALGPHAPYTVSDATYSRVLAFASELDIPIHTHLQETADEVALSRKQYGVTPAARLAGLGVTSAGLVAAHGVHLETADRSLLARAGASVIHCPSSNLKLASGLADVAALLQARVNVGLGTDGAASNNRLDLFEEMRLAALLAKAVSRDAASLPAAQAFLLATRNGARALRLDDRIGTLEAGKRADLVAVRIDAPSATPLFDPVSHLVYVAGRGDVTHVWVDGHPRVTDGRLAEAPRLALAECTGQIATFAERVRALRQ